MRCPVCGTENVNENMNFCAACGAALGNHTAAPSGMSDQQLRQLGDALFGYCKVRRVPKMGFAPVLIVIFEFAAISALCIVAAGVAAGLFIGAFFGGMFAFLVWLVYRLRVGASKRLNTYFATDGEVNMLYDFASAESFVSDQFRIGRQYLFIRNGAVLRIVSIADIRMIAHHYRIVPTGFSMSIIVDDENGRMAFPLCRLHMFRFRAEMEEIQNTVMQRRNFALNEMRNRR